MTNEPQDLQETDDELALPDEEQGPTPEEELEALKFRAKQIGLKFSPKIGVDALRAKVTEALNSGTIPADEPVARPRSATVAPVNKVLLEQARKAGVRKAIHMEQMKLVRVVITNLNPNKKELEGEIFTVANKYVGTVRKFIPYGEATENGYHLPNILFNQLKARKFLSITVRKDKETRQDVVHQKWAPEFALEVLPSLTRSELDRLAGNQMAARGSAG